MSRVPHGNGIDPPLRAEGRENADEPGLEQLAHERIGQGRARVAVAAGRRRAHPTDDTSSAPLLQVLLARLMISDVTLSPETVAADLRPAIVRLARELRKETEQLGITARQATFLWLVKRSPGLSLAELAAEEGISPPAMSGHVDRLERVGLLERVRETTIAVASASG